MDTADTKTRDLSPGAETLLDILTLPVEKKADVSKRAVSFVIDLIVAFVLWQIPFVGKLLGLGYILFRDGFELEFIKGRSIGKKLMGLKPVRLNGRPMDLLVSVRRNWMFVIAGMAGLLKSVPLIGWLIVLGAVGLGVLAALYEIYLVVTEPDGRRWGDIFAGTKIIESTE